MHRLRENGGGGALVSLSQYIAKEEREINEKIEREEKRPEIRNVKMERVEIDYKKEKNRM